MNFKFFRLLAAGAAVLFSASAQESVSAGGQWVRVQEKDSATNAERTAFVLTADSRDFERHPSIALVCDGRSEPVAFYHTDVKLTGQAHDVLNHYAPSIWGRVKVDDGKVYRAIWNLDQVRGHIPNSVVLDRKTVRNLLTSGKLRVLFSDHHDENHVDEFATAGLNISDLSETCGAKWFDKEILSARDKSTARQHGSEPE
jgi:hypothetical protein